MNALIIATRTYDFVNKDTGERLQGAHAYYLDPVMRDDTESTKGLLPLKVPVTSNALASITELPAFYELEFRHRPDAKGRPVLTLAGATFKERLELE